MSRLNPRSLAVGAALLLYPGYGLAQTVPVEVPSGLPNMRSAVEPGMLDTAAFAEWMDGAEVPITGTDRARSAPWVVWTNKSNSGHSGITFGESKNPGPRHLRVGFNVAVPVGTVLARGGGKLSVLRPGSAYPGALNDESAWMSAERLVKGKVSTDPVSGEGYTLWTLPPGTTTRALRFTHTPQTSDARYGGHLAGVFVLEERLVNVAPLALAFAGAGNKHADRLINETNDGTWGAWSNIEDRVAPPSAPVLSAVNSEWVMLAWPAKVRVDGLMALWAGVGSLEVETYTGPDSQHPRDAGAGQWKPVKRFSGLKNGYPTLLWPNRLDLDEPLNTRGIRVRLTSTSEEAHPHVTGRGMSGKRVWLGELMALQRLSGPLAPITVAGPAVAAPRPPIAVRFEMPQAGFATLVIEDAEGKRVRNLVAETAFPKGPNTVYWDGTDDLGRDLNAARHGIYQIPANFVKPGQYRVRGLYRNALNLKYEFTANSPGTPPWPTADTSGGWTTNHTPPSSALFVPGNKAPGGKPLVYIGSYISEGGSGLAWVGLDGRKVGGRGWVGGNWTGAQFLAHDAGPQAVAGAYAYVGSAFGNDADNKKGEVRLTALTTGGDKPVTKYPIDPAATPTVPGTNLGDFRSALGGLAAYNGVLCFSQPQFGRLVFVDAKTGAELGTFALEAPRGVAFDAEGRLLALTAGNLVRYTLAGTPALPTAPQILVTGLEDPQGLTVDGKGNLYVSERGKRHRVHQYTAEGRLVRAFGMPGVPAAGPYNPLRMNNPAGLAVDENNRLWVTEEDFLPKRVSVWNPDGTLWQAYYGPPAYGGGGVLDPQDKTRFYYAEEHGGGMQFRLDWAKGTSEPVHVYSRPGKEHAFSGLRRFASPQTPVYLGGRQYLSNAYNSDPVSGAGQVGLWIMRNNLAHPVAAMGRVGDWPLLRQEKFLGRWPQGMDARADANRNPAFFLWTDASGDHEIQPEEVTIRKGSSGGITVQKDGSFVVSRLALGTEENKAVRFAPLGYSPAGAPQYDLDKGEVLFGAAQGAVSSGGDQALVGTGGWTVTANAPKPFSNHGMGGVKAGVPQWSYPSLWHGLHASHSAPKPDHPGMVIGITRLLGDLVTPPTPGAGPLAFWNGNHGNVYVFTQDGLMVGTLFQDMRIGKRWTFPVATRGLSLNDVTPSDEHFFPTVTQTADGKIYLVAGKDFSAIIEVEGLDSIRRLPSQEITVSSAEILQAQNFVLQREAARQAAQGTGLLRVDLREVPPTVDGKVEDWEGAQWADIDKRGVAAYFDANTKPYDVTGAVSVADGKLYAAWRTADGRLLENSGAVENALFKTGGALDLMIATNPEAKADRSSPVAGDLRLLITQVKGATRATLYRAVVPGTAAGAKVPFSSPWRTITFDSVQDISDKVQLGSDGKGNFEVSVPLEVLGLKPVAGQVVQGDIGILRGDGGNTTARIYWSNKGTATTADVPSEAQLLPNLWGKWEFHAGR